MISHLESALGLAMELSDDITEFLIERSLDEARGHQLVVVDQTTIEDH